MYGPFLKTSPGMRMLESPYLKAIKKSLQKKNSTAGIKPVIETQQQEICPQKSKQAKYAKIRGNIR